MKLGVNVVRLTRTFTGVGRYVECLLRHWAKSGTPFDEVVLYAPRPLRSEHVQFPLERFTMRVVGRSSPDPVWERQTLRHVSSEVDVLLCPSYTIPIGYDGRCAVSYLGPSFNPRKGVESLRASLYDRLYRYSARRADHVFTCSEVVRRRVLECYGVPTERVSVTYLAASDLFTPVLPGLERDKIVSRYMDLGEPYFLYVGKLSGRHFIPELLEGFAMAARRGSFPHRLILAGPDTLNYDVPSYARRIGMAERIFWIPFVPHSDLPALYSAAEGFVFPASEAEGFGIPILEAMACGTPVISTDQGSVSEFARTSALLTPRVDPALLSDAIEKVALDASLRDRLRSGGFQTAARISWGYTADKTMDRLWEIARRGAATSAKNAPVLDGR